ncbi:MAG: GT4 family glycosyltransferase PelF, partial [Rickettsiales bacterium]|nr:GT4 family glycosyltransferase PelF [Rickettsiales bacterium]
MIGRRKEVDVCLILEGSYPYVRGGVSSWVQDLMLSQPHLTFEVVAIVPRDDDQQSLYPEPKNLLRVTKVCLLDMPVGNKKLSARKRKVLQQIEQKLVSFLTKASAPDLGGLLPLLKELNGSCGSYLLLDSPAAWDLLTSTYETLMPHSSFLDYFWSFRALLQGFYSVLLCDLPQAKVYHTCSTGYAGLLGARCHFETGRPLLLTEHGIYTNERRVELLTADWLHNTPYAPSYTVNRSRLELHDLWIGIFTNYSRICYQACSEIITLYRGNQLVQLEDGAEPENMTIIPYGVEYDLFASISRARDANHRPTIAL